MGKIFAAPNNHRKGFVADAESERAVTTPHQPGDLRNKTPQGAATRARIIEAAARIIVERGYAALSMAALRKAADVSSASLYHHFENKAAIVTAVLSQAIHRQTVSALDGADPNATPFMAFAQRIASAKSTRGGSPENAAALLAALVEAESESEDLAGAGAQAHRFAEEATAEEWRQFTECGDGAYFAHVHLAFAGYMNQLARCGAPLEAIERAFTSYARALLFGAVATRPDFLDDPQMTAARDAAIRAMRKDAPQD